MSEEVNKSTGDENLGASANASAGTEVTNTSVAAEALRLKDAADALKKAGKKANPKNWF